MEIGGKVGTDTFGGWGKFLKNVSPIPAPGALLIAWYISLPLSVEETL